MRTSAVKLSLLMLFAAVTFAVKAQTSAVMRHDSLMEVNIKAKAPKLPNVQQVSMRAPDKFKIDGKATEWGNKFQAYNKATNIYYTMANDDKNLYLTVQATDPGIINKILEAGVTLSINKTGKKSLKDAPGITYPMINYAALNSKKMTKMSLQINYNAMPMIIPGSPASVMRADSFMNNNNNRFAEKSKYIMVTGIQGLDTLISVYNQDGIKANALFDNKLVYTSELAVSLKLLGLNTGDDTKFTYNIKLPGKYDPLASGGVISMVGRDGQPVSFTFEKSTPAISPNNPNGQDIFSPTDFWGEYTLAKK